MTCLAVPNLATFAPAEERLIDLAPSDLARVVAVNAPGDDALRLKALGICVGRRIQVVKTGDPLIVRVLGTRVGISQRLAAEVRVARI
ncbi:MAG: ferrous iron transport protein A [Planctomycetales bacterium]|nr:ferrous iron transport protein A [Planctomycetales bacterium]